MPTVQRSGRTTTANSKQYDPTAFPSSMPSTAQRRSYDRLSPYLLLIYPLILAIGSLYHLITTSGSTARPNPDIPTNYFAGKRNLFNLYFVKIGWFWTTLAFSLLHFTTRPPPSNKQIHYVQTAVRWILVTISWALTTQWFFGAALIDRSFVITGGHCEPKPFSYPKSGALETDETTTDYSLLTSNIACKAAGGHWRGGHDISGHVFMLVLSSAFLIYELSMADRHSAHPSVSPSAAAALAHDMTEEEKKAVGGWESENLAKIRVWARYFLYLVVGLDFWMLLMTAIWFHTWLEKLSGLLLAAATVWAVFFLGEFVPAWRSVVGEL